MTDKHTQAMAEQTMIDVRPESFTLSLREDSLRVLLRCSDVAGVGLLLLDRAVKRWVSGHDHAVDDLVRHEFAALSSALR